MPELLLVVKAYYRAGSGTQRTKIHGADPGDDVLLAPQPAKGQFFIDGCRIVVAIGAIRTPRSRNVIGSRIARHQRCAECGQRRLERHSEFLPETTIYPLDGDQPGAAAWSARSRVSTTRSGVSSI